MANRDYYDVLGVSRKATADQIRSAYRKLARKFHPDVNKDDPQAEQKFKEVQEAYDVLSDKQKRAAYDQFGSAGPGGFGGRSARAGGPGGQTYSWSPGGGWPEGVDVGDLGDIFEMFSGRRGGRQTWGRPPAGGRGRQPAARGEDIVQEVELTFEEAALGTRRELVLSGPEGEQRLSVKIPAAVNEGSRIRLGGKGQPGPGGENGDLYIVCHVQPHRWFKREGLDVIIEAPLTLAETALGAKIEVPTLTGRVGVTIPPEASGGSRLRLKKLGIRDERSGQQGDQYVVVRIVLPKKLDEESLRLVREFDRRNPLEPRKDLGW